LKFSIVVIFFDQIKSLPAWGEWIEIDIGAHPVTGDHGLSPHGESGLKSPGKHPFVSRA